MSPVMTQLHRMWTRDVVAASEKTERKRDWQKLERMILGLEQQVSVLSRNEAPARGAWNGEMPTGECAMCLQTKELSPRGKLCFECFCGDSPTPEDRKRFLSLWS